MTAVRAPQSQSPFSALADLPPVVWSPQSQSPFSALADLPPVVWSPQSLQHRSPVFCGADLPPVVDMPGFAGANEPCRKHAFAITSSSDDVISMLTDISLCELRLTLGYLTT
jgi:hypothetical protein